MSTPALSARAAACARSAATPWRINSADGVVIAHDDTVESEPPAQPTREQRRIRGHGYAGQIRERRHDGGHARRHRRREWRHVDLAQVRSEMSTEA